MSAEGTELTPYVAGLPAEDGEVLINQFQQFLVNVDKIQAEAKSIVVTDVNDTAGMAKARTLRLQIKKSRTTVENVRKDLKEGIVKRGRAIDAIANQIKATFEPLEAHLEEQESFAERKRLEAENELRRIRHDVIDSIGSEWFNGVTAAELGTMGDEQWTLIKESATRMRKEKEDLEAKLEQERLDSERREAEEKERVRQEIAAEKAELAKERAAMKAEQDRLNAALEDEKRRNEEILANQASRPIEPVGEPVKATPDPIQNDLGDYEKIKAYGIALGNVQVPSCSSEEGKQFTQRVVNAVSRITKQLDHEVESLFS